MNVNLKLLKLIILLLMLLLLLFLLLWPCLLLLIPLHLVVINECCSEAHGAHVEFVWWGGGVCTVIFVSTPSPTDLDWTVRLDWSLTISNTQFDSKVSQHPCFATE